MTPSAFAVPNTELPMCGCSVRRSLYCVTGIRGRGYSRDALILSANYLVPADTATITHWPMNKNELIFTADNSL